MSKDTSCTEPLPRVGAGAPPFRGLSVAADADVIILSNRNTTVGYARFDRVVGSLDHVFVHPAFRRRGLGRWLLDASERAAGRALSPAEPVSPLGRFLFDARRVSR